MSLLKSLILLFFYRVGIICTMKHSAFFVPFMSSENEASETQSSSIIINQMFHRCGMSESCSLVYEDRMSKKYGMAKNENDLPADTKNYNMWKKMQTGEGLKEDIKSKGKHQRKKQNESTFHNFYLGLDTLEKLPSKK